MIKDRKIWLSGYDILWMMVMFDLPVVDKEDRRAATQFRNCLLDEGFAMAQYSVYYRMISGKDRGKTLERRIMKHLPTYGSVQILQITDKQYENIKSFTGKKREKNPEYEQFLLF